MAESSFPWSVVTAGDRTVTAEMQRRANIVGPTVASGFQGVTCGLAPTKNGTGAVNIAEGSAVIQGVEYILDATLTLTPAAGTRKDYIVLRWTAVDRNIVAAVLQGSSVFPTLTQTSAVWEIAIASVDNSTGAFVVTDTRDASGLCRTYFPTIHNVGAANEPAYASGWSQYQTTQSYFSRTSDGLVTVKFQTVGTTAGTVFTLPVGFRPVSGDALQAYGVTYSGTTPSPCLFSVNYAGLVNVAGTPGTAYTSGTITFQAAG